MRALGQLDKMRTTYINPVQYFLTLGSDQVPMNELIGKSISIRWTGNIYCAVCNNKTKKSFGEGMCWACFSSSEHSSECIIRPELCEAHLGKGRNPEWEHKHHFTPHYVYLALTNSVKVGVTRDTQIPTRWIDQGANKGIILAETPYRQLSGFIEVVLKEHLSDKTNWQRMLKNESDQLMDLVTEKKRILNLIPEDYRKYGSGNDEIVEINYPVLEYPAKVSSISFEKMPSIDMVLSGIRGQYLMFKGGFVFNVRKNTGYEVEVVAN